MVNVALHPFAQQFRTPAGNVAEFPDDAMLDVYVIDRHGTAKPFQ